MSKKVLVIGGSYFAGRAFSMVASREAGFSLTLVNRGRYSMAHLPSLTEYHCDRHDQAALKELGAEPFDAVVDFCAYEPGDIRTLTDALPCPFRRYVYLSTADVYRRDTQGPRDESTAVLSEQPAGAAGDYMYKKLLLEDEARQACAARGAALTILRPAFIYGPYNYAPRESFFIKKIVTGEPIPVPTDSDAQFQFVYVKDVANAIIACVGSEAGDQVYNLSAPEILTYEKFMEVLGQVSDLPFTTQPVTVEQVIRENLPLPFPLTKDEDELFCGERIARELGLVYTPFSEGMKRAYNAFKTVYSH